MRKKQLFALLMAGALSVGMAPTATFAADTAAETSAEGELEGELDSADTEEPSEDPAETPEEPAEDPAETPEDPAETPAETTADPTEAPAAEETDEQAAEAEGTAIYVGDNTTPYTSLADAFAAVPDSNSEDNSLTSVFIQGNLEINSSIEVSANKRIALLPIGDVTIKRAAGFAEDMFTVNGILKMGGSVQDSDGKAIEGALTIDGSGDGVTGSIVKIISGQYGLSAGTTLTGNKTTGNGGAINVAEGAEAWLLGGTITGNSATVGGGIYSEGTVKLQGSVSVSDNTDITSSEIPSNITLGKKSMISVTGAVSASEIGVSVTEPTDKRPVVQLEEGLTDVQLADVLSQITYEGDTKYTLGEDGKLADSTVNPTPTPSTDVVVKDVSVKWTGHNKVQIKFRSNVKGTYYIEKGKRGGKVPSPDTSKKGDSIDPDINVTREVNISEEHEVTIYVWVVSEDGQQGYAKFNPITAERPSAPATPTPTPSHTAVVPDVKESVIQGFEKPLVFYPKTYYDFRVIGAGTKNDNPGEGDVRWVPMYWSTYANPSEQQMQKQWKIGVTSGIYTDTEKTFNLYVFFQKQVYTGNDWNQTDTYESVSYQFKAAPLTQATTTPGANGTNGDGTGSGDGTTDGGTTDVTPTTYADGTNGTAKSAVSTGDESPIGTMLALAAASVLAGGYVLIRRRKKEM